MATPDQDGVPLEQLLDALDVTDVCDRVPPLESKSSQEWEELEVVTKRLKVHIDT